MTVWQLPNMNWRLKVNEWPGLGKCELLNCLFSYAFEVPFTVLYVDLKLKCLKELFVLLKIKETVPDSKAVFSIVAFFSIAAH